MPGRRTSRMTTSGCCRPGELERVLGGRGDADLVPLPFERLAQGPGDGLFVVDDEKCACGHGVRLAERRVRVKCLFVATSCQLVGRQAAACRYARPRVRRTTSACSSATVGVCGVDLDRLPLVAAWHGRCPTGGQLFVHFLVGVGGVAAAGPQALPDQGWVGPTNKEHGGYAEEVRRIEKNSPVDA